MNMHTYFFVIPSVCGNPVFSRKRRVWIPAYAGMTEGGGGRASSCGLLTDRLKNIAAPQGAAMFNFEFYRQIKFFSCLFFRHAPHDVEDYAKCAGDFIALNADSEVFFFD